MPSSSPQQNSLDKMGQFAIKSAIAMSTPLRLVELDKRFWFREINAMDKLIRPILLALLSLCFSGCSSVVDAKYYSNHLRLESMKRAYVVHDPGSTYGCANAAEEALIARGLTVTSGFIQDKPADADFYVEVIDRWQWDLAMYLASLDIRFVDNATGDLITLGTFRQGAFHTFPDQKQKTFEVIASMYSRQPAAK